MKSVITLLITACSITVFAQTPVYQFSFEDTDNMTFAGEKNVTIYPVSE